MLRCEKLSLRREGRLLIQQASFELHAGSRCALTGRNGCGKSSLFALIRGELDADEGACHLPSHWAVAHVAQETPALDHSALEHVLLGDEEWVELKAKLQDEQLPAGDIARLHERFEQIGGWQTEARAAQLLHGLGFADHEFQQPVRSFSGGWRMRLNLAQALLCRSDLLLLDEPTNHLDLETVLWLENWLKQYKGTLLLVSHDRSFLDAICDHVLYLENSRLTLYRGNYSQSEARRLEHRRQMSREAEKQAAQKAHMEDFVRRFRAKASKARQAQSRLKALERLAPILLDRQHTAVSFDFPQPEHLPSPLLVLDDVTLGWQPDQPLLQQIRLTLLPGEKIGLLGANGTGKSTLIQTLAGELPPLEGQLHPARQLRIGYFAQHQMDRLRPESSPREHLQQQSAWSEQQCWNYLGRFQIDQEKAEQPVKNFSGGERVRLALALVIQQQPNLLLLDEPGNHLDMPTREALALALNHFDGAVLMISHDRNLLQLCCERFLVLENGTIHPWEDDLDSWLKQRPGIGNAVQEKKTTNSADRHRRQQAAHMRARLKPLKNACKAAESKVDELQQKLHRLEQQLQDENLYTETNRERLQSLLKQQGQTRQWLQQAEDHWLQQEELLEAEQQRLHSYDNDGER